MSKFDRDISNAVKQRILEEVRYRAERAQIVNNLYGSPNSSGTLQDRMPPDAEDPFEYKVKIGRRNVLDEEGNLIGWDKDVHRYREPKGAKKGKKVSSRYDE
jgi:hypothetical protein